MLDFLFVYLALLSLVDWGLLVVVSLLIVFAIEQEIQAMGLVAVAVGILASWILNGHPWPTTGSILSCVEANWGKAIVVLGAYVVLGIAWSVVKWVFYLHDVADDLAARGYSAKELAGIWERRSAFAENKARITWWMTYWPWSAAWTLFRDPVKRFFAFAAARLKSTYEAISRSIYSSRFPTPKT